ncbi:MAG: PAS domain S-box protein [Gaiellaceae bacterium]
MSSRSDDVLQLTLFGEAAQNADCAVLVVTDEGQVVAVNDAATEFLGYTREELKQGGAHVLADGLDAILHGRTAALSVALRTKGGALLPGELRAVKTRVASLPYLLAFFTPDEPQRRRRRRA